MGKRWILIGVSVCILLLLLVRGVLLELGEREGLRSEVEKESEKEQEAELPEEDVNREWVLRNVWVQESGARSVRFLGPDGWEERETQSELSVEIQGEVVDLYGEGEMIHRIVRKPERITGRVLLLDEESGELELEGYEPLTLDEDVTVYDLRGTSESSEGDEESDEVSLGSISQIVLGYGAADYVVAEGKVCAVLICREIVPEDIRVLIKTTGYGEVYHESIRLTYQGETITIRPGSDQLEDGRCVLTDPDGIRVESVERSLGHPVYQGSLEIQETPQGLLLINEVDLETYLKGVLPSEMPSSFPEAALQVQAVCARSYALRQLMEGGCRRYGAHVDDSVSYQVYQNVAATEETDAAVKKTEGQVLLWEDEPALTSYFSTSCGMTSAAHKVWIGMDEIPYLTGQLQKKQDDGEEGTVVMDLSAEEAFRTFLLEEKDAYEAAVSWYRWKTTVSAAHLKKSIDSTLLARYRATPELIQTWQEGKYVSVPVDTVGQVEEIRILRRETEGLVTEIEIRGSKNQVRICGEYNIRTVLAPVWDSVIRKDGSEISGSTMLPSAYILLEEERDKGELVSVTIRGGGYGHGVGMSQYGARILAESGMKYKKILSHYYPGTELKFLY